MLALQAVVARAATPVGSSFGMATAFFGAGSKVGGHSNDLKELSSLTLKTPGLCCGFAVPTAMQLILFRFRKRCAWEGAKRLLDNIGYAGGG